MFCIKCGHELADDAKFCSNCGAPVEADSTVEYNVDNKDIFNESNKAQETGSKANGFAIAGFVCSFLFPLLGIIFSSIGLYKVKKCNRGKGLAIAGIIIGAVFFIINILIREYLAEYLEAFLEGVLEGFEGEYYSLF